MTANEPKELPAAARVAVEHFPAVFGADEGLLAERPALGVAWAPGRVNLIGEHTDYNEGFVLPLAVDRVVAFAGRGRRDGRVRLWSCQFQELAEIEVEGLPAAFTAQAARLPAWARYVLAVLSELKAAGLKLRGFSAVINGDVPLGGGMSSSAALEVATAWAAALFSEGGFGIGEGAAAAVALKPLEVARLCQQAEHLASGVRCGILDQAASCLGRPGQALLLDCRSLEFRYLPFESERVALLVADTHVRRELAASAYNERRQQCEEAAHLLAELVRAETESMPGSGASRPRIVSLRDVTPELLARYSSRLPAVLRRRATYVVAENERVLAVARLLEGGEVEAVGSYLWQTHEGLRDQYEVSCLELDTLVEIARQVEGVLGARMMGGGFGGCTINLVRSAAVEPLSEAILREYPRRTGRPASVEVCRAAGGPGALSLPA
ncbi:galactokinase [Thermogemmatispora sp.]|uniref:galactokinase n=1 Tax=Thermogemmatispora sp. TaxID=1968838 RepID=UPI001D7D6065|nr:galactokinase [Thermogemmatispora sp.]MBX5450747.1 galactokinase [Thermogemmatispora sp.]